jgi:hypothetical protein
MHSTNSHRLEGLKMAANPHLRVVAPTTEKQTVAPDMDRRRPNAELRSREHPAADEVERLIAAAGPTTAAKRGSSTSAISLAMRCPRRVTS